MRGSMYIVCMFVYLCMCICKQITGVCYKVWGTLMALRIKIVVFNVNTFTAFPLCLMCIEAKKKRIRIKIKT